MISNCYCEKHVDMPQNANLSWQCECWQQQKNITAPQRRGQYQCPCHTHQPFQTARTDHRAADNRGTVTHRNTAVRQLKTVTRVTQW